MKRSTSKPEIRSRAQRSFPKRLWVAVFLVGFILVASAAFAGPPGDVNDDGILNVVDLQCVVLASLSMDPAQPPECAAWPGAGDLNCDEGTNVVDIQLIVRMSLAKLHGLPGIPVGKDYDHDNIHNACDGCPHQWDPANGDSDQDGVGDVCDPTPEGGDSGDLCEEKECDSSLGWGCVKHSCNPQTGACENWPAGDLCDDEDPCTADWCDYETGACQNDLVKTYECGYVEPIDYGDILITEFLANPTGSDYGQEFVELYNNTPYTIDLNGLMVHDEGSDSFMITSTLLVEAHSYVVLGSTDSDGERSGHPADYLYPRSAFMLANSADEIMIVFEETLVDVVRYTSAWPVKDGKSLGLHPGKLHPSSEDDPADWCVSQSVADFLADSPSNDAGSPGGSNESCE